MKNKSKQLAIYKSGEGRPVILLHGFISTHRYWRDVVKHIPADKVRLVLPDLLGFGASPKPRKATHTLDEHIAYLENSLEDVLQENPLLVGHSMGGCIALEWLLKRPEVFSGAVITGLPYVQKSSLTKQVLGLGPNGKLQDNPRLEKALFHMAKGISYAPAKIMPRLMKTVPKHVAEDTTKHNASTRKKIVDQLFLSVDVMQKLTKITVPTAVIAARDDSMVYDFSELKQQVAHNKHMKFIEVGGGHQIPLVHPKLVVETIMSIIGSHEY